MEVGSRWLSGAAARTGDLKEKEKDNIKRREIEYAYRILCEW